MGYIEANLSSDERVIASIKHSWAGIIGRTVAMLFFVAIGICIFCIEDIVFHFGVTEKMPSSYKPIFYIFASLFLVCGLILFLESVIEIKSAQLVLTNKRIFGRRGFISKITTDVVLSHIDTIVVNNGFFGALFHFGTIHIVSTGQQTPISKRALLYGFISNTMEFRKAVLDELENVKTHEREEQARLIAGATSNSNKKSDD